MFDVTAIVGGLSTQVKIGWAVWFLWGSVLIEWYYRGRVFNAGTARGVSASIDAR